MLHLLPSKDFPLFPVLNLTANGAIKRRHLAKWFSACVRLAVGKMCFVGDSKNSEKVAQKKKGQVCCEWGDFKLDFVLAPSGEKMLPSSDLIACIWRAMVSEPTCLMTFAHVLSINVHFQLSLLNAYSFIWQ